MLASVSQLDTIDDMIGTNIKMSLVSGINIYSNAVITCKDAYIDYIISWVTWATNVKANNMLL